MAGKTQKLKKKDACGNEQVDEKWYTVPYQDLRAVAPKTSRAQFKSKLTEMFFISIWEVDLYVHNTNIHTIVFVCKISLSYRIKIYALYSMYS